MDGIARSRDVLPAVACAALTVPAMDSTLFDGSPFLSWHPSLWVTVPVAALIGIAALAGRSRPLLFTAVAGGAWIVAAAYPAVVLAQYTLGAYERSRRRVAVATGLVTLAVAVPFRREGLDAILPLGVALCAAPTLLGLWVASRRAKQADLHERAEREQQQRIEQARAEERARIAYDMHDVVTHRVSLMVLHATAAEVSPGDERDALVRTIRTIGREALDELRSLVDVLATEGGAPLAPQPRLGDVHRLAAQSTSAVDVRITGPIDELPVLLGQTGYRVVQEALTNVHKHAPGAPAVVTLECDEAAVTIDVVNERGRTPIEPVPSGRHGLLGLTERVRLAGGSFDAGPTAGGGFRVTAVLPRRATG